MKVLLTARLVRGSGFIAAHCLEYLLKQGESVVVTVRSQAKADRIAEAYQSYNRDKLSFAIVQDIAKPGAFDKVVVSDPPIEAIIHTASPFHFRATNVRKELLEPAVNGTTGILKAAHAFAPFVKRIVITSSFAAIFNSRNTNDATHTYSEIDWNPISEEEAVVNANIGYTGSKKLAEKAAWEFMEREKPAFDLVTITPPLVIGPIVHHLNSLDLVNTSNQRTRDCLQGKWKDGIPDTGRGAFVDVRDAALAHVKAIGTPSAGGKRFLVVSDKFSNRDIAEVIRRRFPEYQNVPGPQVPGGALPAESFRVDNSRSREILGLQYRPFEPAIVDLVMSLQAAGLKA